MKSFCSRHIIVDLKLNVGICVIIMPCISLFCTVSHTLSLSESAQLSFVVKSSKDFPSQHKIEDVSIKPIELKPKHDERLTLASALGRCAHLGVCVVCV